MAISPAPLASMLPRIAPSRPPSALNARLEDASSLLFYEFSLILLSSVPMFRSRDSTRRIQSRPPGTHHSIVSCASGFDRMLFRSLLCEPGRYSNVSGESTCSPCPPGFYRSSPGGSTCESCQVCGTSYFDSSCSIISLALTGRQIQFL